MVKLSRSRGSGASGHEDTSGVSWRSHLPGGQGSHVYQTVESPSVGHRNHTTPPPAPKSLAISHQVPLGKSRRVPDEGQWGFS